MRASTLPWLTPRHTVKRTMTDQDKGPSSVRSRSRPYTGAPVLLPVHIGEGGAKRRIAVVTLSYLLTYNTSVFSLPFLVTVY